MIIPKTMPLITEKSFLPSRLSAPRLIARIFLPFALFAGLEDFFVFFFLGKYWPYYVFSAVTWVVIGPLLCFMPLGISFLILKVYSKFKPDHEPLIRNSLFILAFFSPAFLYTILQAVKCFPGTCYSFTNVIVCTLLFILFFCICVYLYTIWNDKPGEFFINNYLPAIILFGFSGISGSFLVASELQNDHWMISLCFILLFCMLIPFSLVVILGKRKSTGRAGKILLAMLLAIFLLFGELHFLCPVRDRFAFQQAAPFGTRKKGLGNVPENAPWNALENTPNIVLIVMDTTRAADMSLYGYQNVTTPHLSRFAEEAVLFKNAISSAPWTLPSHASLFTGLSSRLHGAVRGETEGNIGLPLKEQFDTLAELLAEHGYRTGAVVANHGYLAPWTGLNQGFGYYWWGGARDCSLFLYIIGFRMFKAENSSLFRICGIQCSNSAKRINQIALDWLRRARGSGPWFLFINYMETHGFNYLPSPYAKRFTMPPNPSFSDEKKREKIRLWYDNELASVDHEIGSLFTSLKKMTLYESAAVIVTSDHGELLGEHGDFGHNKSWLYQELVHVPLIVKYPFGKKKGKRIDKMIQHIDLFAEVLNLANIAIPPFVQGEPFSEANHPVVSEVYGHTAKAKGSETRKDRSGSSETRKDCSDRSASQDQGRIALYSSHLPGCKLIRSVDGCAEVYDLKSDPRESNAIRDTGKTRILEEELDGYLNSLHTFTNARANFEPKRKLSPAARERLRSLGYINR
ncbi:MAG: sulfatase [bacterium]